MFVDDSEPLQINICSGRHPVCIFMQNLFNILCLEFMRPNILLVELNLLCVLYDSFKVIGSYLLIIYLS
jgi:hypothetical protein